MLKTCTECLTPHHNDAFCSSKCSTVNTGRERKFASMNVSKKRIYLNRHNESMFVGEYTEDGIL